MEDNYEFNIVVPINNLQTSKQRNTSVLTAAEFGIRGHASSSRSSKVKPVGKLHLVETLDKDEDELNIYHHNF